MRTLKKSAAIVFAILIVTAIVGASAMQVRRKKQTLAQAPRFGVGPVPVHVVESRAGSMTQSRNYLAVVEPVQTADVSARLTSEIQSITCDEGDVLQAGDVMAVLDSREIRAEIATSETQILQAQEDLQASEVLVNSLTATVEYWRGELARDQSLRKSKFGAISAADVEATEEKLQLKQGELASTKFRLISIRHGIDGAQDRKQELETKLAYCTIVSPFSGIVAKRLVDPGHMAVSGKVLFHVEDRSMIRLAFDVPQIDLAQIRPGLPVVFDEGGKLCLLSVSRLYPSLDAVRMTRAEVDVSGPAAADLITGAYLPLSVELQRFDDAVIIPASALVDPANAKQRVFIVEQDQLVLRPVTVLATQQNELAVSGVRTGEQVVVHTFLGWARYYPGQKVEVIR